jgi:anaerobic selenocysteine-containing dehydrogenase
LVGLENGRLCVRGDSDHPATRGLLCAKTMRFGQRLHAPDRITRPLLRQDGVLRECSWETALEVAAQRIQALRNRPRAMLHVFYVGSYGVLFRASSYFFGRLGASERSGDYCLDGGIEAQTLDFGTIAEPELDDLAASRTIVNWGRNLDAEGMLTGRHVRAARDRGAVVLAITPGDPGYKPYADRVITIRPGTDRFLALAVLRLLEQRERLPAEVRRAVELWPEFKRLMDAHPVERLLDACDVSPDDAETLARAYAERPCASILGRGLQRYRYGGENVRFIDALALLSGNMGVLGGGTYFCCGDRGHIDYSWHVRPEKPPRTLPTHDLGGALERADQAGDPVELVWVEGTNVVTQSPDSARLARALEKPFVIAVEAFPNDTVDVADLVLPPALMWEWEDVTRCSSHGWIHHSAKVLDPPGECLSNFEISRQVAARLDPPLLFPSSEEVLKTALVASRCSTSLAELRQRTYLPSPKLEPPFQNLQFAHADGRARLPVALHPEPRLETAFPLHLLTLVDREHLLSQIPEAEQLREPCTVYVAPDCKALAGLDLSAPLQLVTERGALPVRLESLPGLHREAAYLRRGGWMKCGRGLNALIGPHVADLAGQCAYYAQHCRLENVDGD